MCQPEVYWLSKQRILLFCGWQDLNIKRIVCKQWVSLFYVFTCFVYISFDMSFLVHRPCVNLDFAAKLAEKFCHFETISEIKELNSYSDRNFYVRGRRSKFMYTSRRRGTRGIRPQDIKLSWQRTWRFCWRWKQSNDIFERKKFPLVRYCSRWMEAQGANGLFEFLYVMILVKKSPQFWKTKAESLQKGMNGVLFVSYPFFRA